MSILGGCSELLGPVSSTSLLEYTLGWVLNTLWLLQSLLVRISGCSDTSPGAARSKKEER